MCGRGNFTSGANGLEIPWGLAGGILIRMQKWGRGPRTGQGTGGKAKGLSARERD